MKLSHKLIAVTCVNPAIVLDIRYAMPNNFTGKVIYPQAGCYLREEVAYALGAVQKELAPIGLGIKVFDGYRPLCYQQLFWDIMPDERYVAHPQKGSRHNRGAAVDVTLITLADGKELAMPSEFDDFSEQAHRNYATMDREAARNCKLLETVMAKHGFIGWYEEWWHFDYKNWESYPLSNISFKEIEAQRCLEK